VAGWLGGWVAGWLGAWAMAMMAMAMAVMAMGWCLGPSKQFSNCSQDKIPAPLEEATPRKG